MRKRPDPPQRQEDEDEDEAALFRAAIGPVRVLPAPEPLPEKPKPRAWPRMAERDEREAREEFRRMRHADSLQAGDALSHRRDSVPARVMQRLRKGQYAAQDELDLHGVDAATAEAMLRRFLRGSVQAGMGCVRIVHGKGLNSGTGVPVMKNLVDRVLRQRADVIAFHSAPAAQGGTGAVLVLLAAR